MKNLKFLSAFLFVIVALVSCESSDDSSDNSNGTGGGDNPTFTLYQNNSSPQELDAVNFSVNSTNGGFNDIKWYVNNNLIQDAYYDLDYTFLQSGNFTVRADITYYNNNGNQQSTSLENIVTVNERPKYLVTVKKVEVLAFDDFSDYVYNQYDRCSLKSYFDIKELDEYGSDAIQYTSTENTENLGEWLYSFQEMDWDIASANYQAIVYKTGNYYPNNQYYNFAINFYGASEVYGTPYSSIDDFGYDLNPYRNTRPSEITFNTYNMSVKLTLEWN
ncbi:MAG: hypothetical protein ACPGU9_05610 [Flavobacteriaceae bacterium]